MTTRLAFRPVTSSVIQSVAYDQRKKRLFIRFLSGSTYTYYGVARWRLHAFLRADSKGSYFAHRIRNSYAYSRGIRRA